MDDEAHPDDVMQDETATEEQARLPPLSPDEQRALELYDRLQELRLEMAIVQAQQKHQHTDADENMTPEQVAAARNQLLETRARYLLRSQVVDSVLSANPILKAVHNGVEASPVERDLLGYIQQRDEVSISLARLASATGDVRERATRAQSESHVASRENTQLAGNIMDLVARVKEKRSGGHEAARGDDEDEATTQLKDELRRARQRWRVMKGITSGVVAGSGVDWARDETLRDLVLDPEDDDEDGVEV